MKTRKLRKFLMLLASALLLVSVTVGATVAYLTATDEVVNTFTVGKVGLTLDEADVKVDGTYEKDATVRVDANAYHLLPGKTYIKDPTVHIAEDSEDGILFVKVENGIADIEGEKKIAVQMTEKGWAPIAEGSNVYYYNRVVTNEDGKIVVFDNFTIKGDVSETALDSYKTAQVKVTAYLIQAEGFVNTVDGSLKTTEAWAALNPSAAQ